MRRSLYFVFWAMPFVVSCGGGSSPTLPTNAKPSDGTTKLPPSSLPIESDSQPDPLPSVRKIVPKGFELVESDEGPIYAEGDLDDDGRSDVAFLLQDMHSEYPASAVAVGIRQHDSSFRFSEKTGNLGPEPLQYTDPEMLAIDHEVLVISYQSMRWGVDLHFRMGKGHHDLRLIRTETQNLGAENGDGEGSAKTDYLKGIRIGHYKRWDASQGKSVALPESREKVSTSLKFFSTFNDDSVYVEQ